ncbi:MAG TPA: transglycosylase SLT domain-containing protein [Syntrophorhabdus sp.]|jgi:soluble lytic murein transglycosylase|nr:transglycosylase SLT domain-containing protein [Syntrophorhabdus sp.]OPX97333.1 MAG: Soluble lytic murein transglycosylase precursor [Syntrophorhabdus sp. PtaB.Bin027]OQB78446.1 MAG: Soluble lytic murein transglycosylase precursor [Deltaproteobacteria bacterium ADurb.Bin135]HOD77376.1 transglycosylase SLT domain-containing protein [Syntrophorhabdus sp.]HQG25518.1 transglycosylase SLT domain-containing protein [Syntrophorhabdus sp.]
MVFRLIILIAMCIFPLQGMCGIYGYVDESGVFHFTNIKPANNKKYRVIVPDSPKPALGFYAKTVNTDQYDSLIKQHSFNHGVDPTLVKAVMKAESNFNSQAVSPKGAQGLMQLMPDTARHMRVYDPFDPDDNIRGGTKYLRLLDDTFQGNLELILAAYNAGPNRVKEHNMNVPPFEETRNFIKRVKHFYNKLKNTHEG